MAEFSGVAGPIHYGHWSPPNPRALVVFLHGLGEHIGSYAPFVAALNAAGIAVWANDHAGHGRSAGERVLISSVDAMVEDAATLVELARAAHPEPPLLVIGHSLGSLLAVLLVAERGIPATALVLAGSAVVPAPDAPNFLGELLASGVDPWELRRDPGELTRHEGYAQQLRDDPLTWQGGLRRETLAALVTVVPRQAAAVEKLELPVLFVHGEQDDMAPVAGVRRALELLPQASAAIFPDDRHNILNELDREDVYRVVVEFCARHI
ncbi:alpha/beta fold hydrolase [Nocardia panacis]|uniref:Alpha/beta fold hydrolase n=1 Tax=Nocardia panacis TaxID=2340916 RepID=A0A3A4JWT8_9NOCA|nr:alpha/beta fold hydrolase [Nocardia panacis]RJO75029.1 alpha/beta fold hydrolase [Nocardia panacis]